MTEHMSESPRLARLSLARVDRGRLPAGEPAAPMVATGHAAIDRALGGGLALGRLHELLADRADYASASGFAGLLARLIGGDLLWLGEEAGWRRAGMLYPAGLAAIGLDPGRLIVAALPDATAVLRAAVDGLRCPALGGVVIALSGDPAVLDLTASRRLALAAAADGVTAILIRPGGEVRPTAAQTRWRVAAAPSVPLAAGAPGHPAWDLALLRQRGRPDGCRWRVEWNRDEGRLRDWQDGGAAMLPRPVVSLPADRPAAAPPLLRCAG